MIHVLVGLPGSGKTEWAKRFRRDNGGIILSKDIIRREMFGVEFDPDLEGDVYNIFNNMYTSALCGSIENIIIDNTNLTMYIRGHIKRRGVESIIAHVFNCKPYTAWKRKKASGSRMSLGDFSRLVALYEPISDKEGFTEVLIHDAN